MEHSQQDYVENPSLRNYDSLKQFELQQGLGKADYGDANYWHSTDHVKLDEAELNDLM